MSIARRFNATAVIHRVSETGELDAHGNPVTTTADGEERCYFQQGSSEEQPGGGEQTSTDGLAIFGPGVAIDANDRVTITRDDGYVTNRGNPWTVAGDPRRPAPRGREHHVHCILKAVT